jgi:hypothetical protein
MRGVFRPGLGALAVVGALLLAGGVAYRTVVVLASPDAVSLRCTGRSYSGLTGVTASSGRSGTTTSPRTKRPPGRSEAATPR